MLSLKLLYLPEFYEPLSSLSHFFGGIVFSICFYYLIKRGKGNRGKQISLTIFGLATVFTLVASGIYHLYAPDDSLKIFFQKVDHTLIFLLIVGTITPIHYILFKRFMKWGVIIITWTLTIVAISLKMIYFEQFPEWLGMTIYLVLGWGGIITASILWFRNSFAFIKPLIVGGIVITAGALLDFFNQPVIIEGFFESHELFHFFVMIGLALFWKFMFSVAQRKMEVTYKGFDDNKDQIAA